MKVKIRRREVIGLALVLALLAVQDAEAAKLRGLWLGPLGAVKMSQTGDRVVGRLLRRHAGCDLEAGDRVVDGSMMDGNFSGKVRLCRTACATAGPAWGFAMLVRAGPRLSGAAALKVGPGCKVRGRTAKGGVVFRRKRRARRPPPTAPPLVVAPEGEGPGGALDGGGAEDGQQMIGPEQEGYDPRAAGDVREKAMNVARDGEHYLQEGRFEKARERFQEAVTIDPSYAEGYNGIGVTYALRRDWPEAARWYQRSIGTNPDIGDAYYNLACAYAQMRKGDLAVRYLRIAVMNGYSEVAHLQEDPDLQPLRKRKDYRSVIRLGKIAAAAGR